MIRVSLPASPAHYVSTVRQPGLAFLAATPHPTRDDWQRHRYWSEIHGYLYREHQGVCGYCASWTPRRPRKGGPDHTSIDHFIPKSRDPQRAYEWENFRLARAKLNNRKADFEDVVDPCGIQAGWFQLSFSTFLIRPAADLPFVTQQRIRDTIARLELNSDPAYINERARVAYRYAAGKFPFNDLERLYPFVAAEMTAQHFDAVLKPSFLTVLAKRPWLAN